MPTSTSAAGAIIPFSRGAAQVAARPCATCKERVEARVARGDPGADIRVLDALPAIDRILPAAERLLGSWDLALDAVQDALLDLWEDGRDVVNPAGWLRAAAVHRGLHLRRTRGRRAAHEARIFALRPPAAEPGVDLAEAEAIARIRAAIEELPLDLRDVVQLRASEGLDYEALAARLEVPVGTVRSRLHRARARLQGTLAPAPARERA